MRDAQQKNVSDVKRSCQDSQTTAVDHRAQAGNIMMPYQIGLTPFTTQIP